MPSTGPESFLHVAAGVIRNRDGEILLTQRRPGRHQAGKWEFPGGKCEPGETPRQALARELHEELGITVDALTPRIQVPYRYPDVSVLLEVFDVNEYSGTAYGVEGQATAWVDVGQLNKFEYPAANLPVITSLRLPECYAISDAAGLGPQKFLKILERELQQGLKLVQLREPGMDAGEYRALALKCVDIVHRYNGKVLLNTHEPGIVTDVGADGIHLNSRTLASLAERPLPDQLLVAASCHNLDEVRQAERIDASFVVFSPVKATASHPEATPIGWSGFAEITRQSALPVYALGGMSRADIPMARESGGQGVAMLGAAWRES